MSKLVLSVMSRLLHYYCVLSRYASHIDSCILIFTSAYALNFLNRSLGSLFWLLRVPIGSLFHKKLGPYWVPISKLGGPYKFLKQWFFSPWQWRALVRSRAVPWQEEGTTTFSLRLDYSTTDACQISQCKGMKKSGEKAIAFVPDTPVPVMLLLLCCLYILFAY